MNKARLGACMLLVCFFVSCDSPGNMKIEGTKWHQTINNGGIARVYGIPEIVNRYLFFNDSENVSVTSDFVGEELKMFKYTRKGKRIIFHDQVEGDSNPYVFVHRDTLCKIGESGARGDVFVRVE